MAKKKKRPSKRFYKRLNILGTTDGVEIGRTSGNGEWRGFNSDSTKCIICGEYIIDENLAFMAEDRYIKCLKIIPKDKVRKDIWGRKYGFLSDAEWKDVKKDICVCDHCVQEMAKWLKSKK